MTAGTHSPFGLLGTILEDLFFSLQLLLDEMNVAISAVVASLDRLWSFLVGPRPSVSSW